MPIVGWSRTTAAADPTEVVGCARTLAAADIAWGVWRRDRGRVCLWAAVQSGIQHRPTDTACVPERGSRAEPRSADGTEEPDEARSIGHGHGTQHLATTDHSAAVEIAVSDLTVPWIQILYRQWLHLIVQTPGSGSNGRKVLSII